MHDSELAVIPSAGPLDATRRSPSRYQLALAGPDDDDQIRALLRATPMTGPVEVTLRREPSYFESAVVEGVFRQVLVARETSTGRIVGMGSRSVRHRWVDRRALPVGYLGGLRLLPSVRHTRLLVRGFQELARLHADGRADFYVTTIGDDNRAAMSALSGRRAGLPAYHEVGRYMTFVLPVGRVVQAPPTPQAEIRPLDSPELPRLVEYLNEAGRERPFYPCLTEDDFGSPAATFRGLRLNRILCAWRGGEIVGTLAAWDQSAFRQIVVEGYSLAMRWRRRLYNPLARLRGLPTFPEPGSPLPSLTLALPMTRDESGDVFLALLAAVQQMCRGTMFDSFLLGLFEWDPLVSVVRPIAMHSYVTRVFVVTWDAAGVRPEQFVGRNAYLELGCL